MTGKPKVWLDQERHNALLSEHLLALHSRLQGIEAQLAALHLVIRELVRKDAQRAPAIPTMQDILDGKPDG